jgi:branched-subunit amino acid transport protein
MNLKWTVYAFIAGAALSWGVYVPLVHDATMKLGSNLRAFLMVGVAYFLVAVLVPSVFIFTGNDPTVKNPAKLNWLTPNMFLGLMAGMSGAAGALCVIFAVKDAGSIGPLIVAPLVFAGAPIVNTISSMTIFSHGKKFDAPGPLFYLGLLLAAGGMAMVMLNKPKEATAKAAEPATAPASTDGGKA